MSENKQPLDKQDENVDMTTGQPYVPAGTSRGTGLPRNENGPTIRRQTDAHPADRGMSTGLTRALMGGLIGATLGTLAGALANKRTAEGVNHAAKGVGVAVKSVAEGVNHAAKGVGVAVKSVAEGVNYAVVGGLKDTAEDVKPSVIGAVDAVKGAAEDVTPSDNQSFKRYEDRVVEGNKQVTTGSVGIGKRTETQTVDISAPVEKRFVVKPTTPVEMHRTSVAPEHNTVEVEDKTRQEDLDLDTQGLNVTDQTNTL